MSDKCHFWPPSINAVTRLMGVIEPLRARVKELESLGEKSQELWMNALSENDTLKQRLRDCKRIADNVSMCGAEHGDTADELEQISTIAGSALEANDE